MSGNKYYKGLIIILALLFSAPAFAQQFNYRDSIADYNTSKANLKPTLSYSVGSTFIIVPHLGTLTGFTISPFLSVPISPKLSVDGGIIAGRLYSAIGRLSPEGAIIGSFNELSLYGSASYHVNSQLTIYGSGMKQLTNASSFNLLPKSSYSLGSTYRFGNFSVGVTLQMSKWNDNLSPVPFNGTQGFYSPYEQRTGTLNPFGR